MDQVLKSKRLILEAQQRALKESLVAERRALKAYLTAFA